MRSCVKRSSRGLAGPRRCDVEHGQGGCRRWKRCRSALAGFRIQPLCRGRRSRPSRGPLAGLPKVRCAQTGPDPVRCRPAGVALRPLDRGPRNSVLMLKHGAGGRRCRCRVGSASGASRGRRRAVECVCVDACRPFNPLAACAADGAAPAAACRSAARGSTPPPTSKDPARSQAQRPGRACGDVVGWPSRPAASSPGGDG